MGQWLWQQAERDLAVARRLLYPGAYYAVANFAHQGAEKALKAACWHLRAEEPPWRHDLVRCDDLVAECTGGLPPEIERAVGQLQPLFEASRYPSGNANEPIPADLIGEGDATASIRSAEGVMEWVQMLLQQPPGRSQRKTSD